MSAGLVVVGLGVAALLGAALAAIVIRALQGRRLGAVLATAGLDSASSPEARLHRLERFVASAAATQRAAEDAETRLVAALDAFPQAVLLCDEAGELTFANRAAARFIAARHGDALVGAAVRDLMAEVAGRGQDRGRREVQLSGPPRQCFNILVQPLTSGGAIAVAEDVTERRRLEDVRRDFVANISHELKTPVGAMALLAETMTGEDDPELVLRLAGRLHHEAMRVGRTIDDLLVLSRIETDATRAVEVVDVGLVIAETLDRVGQAAENRRISLEVEHLEPGLRIPGDARQLASALYNLVDNALKYSEDGSVVAVSCRLVGGDVHLSVCDRGIGIPAHDLERVFERFYRVDKGRSRRTGGTGLGLAIVRHVAQNHGGRVTVESREGEGSTFTLVLPSGAGEPVTARAPLATTEG